MDIRARGAFPVERGFWSLAGDNDIRPGCNDPLAHVLVLPSIILCLLRSRVARAAPIRWRLC